MHLVIEGVIEKLFRGLIIEIHPPRFQQFFFSKPEMNVENGCLIFVSFIQFFRCDLHRLKIIVN